MVVDMDATTRTRAISTGLLIACFYYISGRLGLMLSIPPGFATSIWPPSGIALASVLLGGYRVWPGVFIGSFLINIGIAFDASSTVTILQSIIVGAGIASGAAVQAVVGAWLVRRKLQLPTLLEKEEDVFYLIVLGGFISCLINATISTTILHISGVVPTSEFTLNLLTWWIGDGIGVMIFTPLILMLFVPKDAVSLQRKLLVTLPLILLFSSVVGIFIYTKHTELASSKQSLERKMADHKSSLRQYMDHMAMYLHSVDTFYQAEDQVSRAKFHTFVQYMLQNHADIAALEWIPRVKSADRAVFEARARNDGLHDFQFWQKNAQGDRIPASPREEYYPVYYLEPYKSNAVVAGFDLASDPTRQIFLQKAIDQNRLIVTPRLHLIQDPQGEYAVIYYQAIFPANVPLDTVAQRRLAVTGFAVAVLRISTAIQSALGNIEQKGLNLQITDISSPDHPQLLYDSARPTESRLHTHEVSTSTIEIGGRLWQLVFRTTGSAQSQSNWTLWAVLIGGMFFTGLFGALLLITTGRNDVVRRLVQQKTDELRKSEGHFELAITGASVGIWDWNTVSGEMYWSPILNKIFGISDPHFVPSFEYFESRLHPDDRARTIAALRSHLDGASLETTYDVEYRLRKNDGQYVWIYSHGQTVCDGEQPPHISGSVLDITSRKQFEQALKASEELLRSSMEHAPIGMALVAPDGKFLKVNKALCQLIGYSEAEFLQLDFQAITHTDDLAKDTGYVQQMLQRHIETYKMEKRYIHKDGHIVWIQLSVSLITDNDNQPLYFISQMQDISERKQADIIKQDLLRKLTESNTELERFAYVASHDMQEPLRMISNFSQLIAREYHDKLDQDGQQYIDLITSSTRRIQLMVSDLLEYARIGNDTSKFSWIDGNTEIEQALMNLSETIKEHHAVVSHDAMPSFKGNPVQFMRLIQNLLNNALNYLPAGQAAQVHIGVEDQGACWRFSFRDNGIGIQEKFLNQIFEPFKRLHSWHQRQGTGLGLSICKKIVENHGGQIWATSEVGIGSVFYFTIPKNNDQPPLGGNL